MNGINFQNRPNCALLDGNGIISGTFKWIQFPHVSFTYNSRFKYRLKNHIRTCIFVREVHEGVNFLQFMQALTNVFCDGGKPFPLSKMIVTPTLELKGAERTGFAKPITGALNMHIDDRKFGNGIHSLN